MGADPPSGPAGVRVVRGDAGDGSEAAGRFESDGLVPRSWGNPPDDVYGWHSHPYHKVLYCVEGSIAFHTREGDVELRPGDRLEIPPGTEHAATVGPDGVRCLEASR